MTGGPALLLLEDGRAFEGEAFGAAGPSFGEVVFNTAMAGYQETLTDPSYRGQIVVMTVPHVGNYGVNAADAESSRMQVAGFAARHFPERPSNARGERSLGEALVESGRQSLLKCHLSSIRAKGLLDEIMRERHTTVVGKAAWFRNALCPVCRFRVEHTARRCVRRVKRAVTQSPRERSQ